MSYCTLLLAQLLTFQCANLGIVAGKVSSSSEDNLYESTLMLGVHGDYLFNDNVIGRIEYSRIWLRERTLWGWESCNADAVYGTFHLTKRVFNFADVYAFGGGGFWMSPLNETKLGACYGIGARKTIFPSAYLELNFRIHQIFDEAPSREGWQSFSAGLGIGFTKSSQSPTITMTDEAEIILRYLAPELRESGSLESDDETKRFVEEFWKANDPTPHTPENEFKQDVFSRIEYANTYFKETRVGWKTDRGRIWIIWGEPDEVIRDEKPLHATERWVYFKVYRDISPVVFVFEQHVSDYRQVFSNVPGEFGHRPSRPD
jgi:GWxTD domain-containing protein